MTGTMPDEFAVLTTTETALADRIAVAAGTSFALLMERAGRAVADAVLRRTRHGARVLVLCGPGHNGGDGFVAARLLRERGHRIDLVLLGSVDGLSRETAAMALAWGGPILTADDADFQDCDLIVDAMFGAGLGRPLDGAAAALALRANESGRPIVSVDVPSGLPGDGGAVGGIVVQASETVTFFRLKPGHLQLPGRSLCGIVTLVDIGIAAEQAFGAGGIAARTFRNAPELWQMHWPKLAIDTHKYRRGAVLVVAGGLAGVGAPRLAARAALRSGAGLVTIACRPEALAAHAARGPDALMQRAVEDPAALEAMLADKRLGAVAIGPALGLDSDAREAVMAVLRWSVPAVLDADALTLVSSAPGVLRRRIERRDAPCVLTPHEGEFARLFSAVPAVASAGSKLERARAAASFSGCIVVLKGPDTVVADPSGRAIINTTGSPALATAGSGDVLGGIVAGLLAQGMPAFEAACAAVWIHGRIGERQGPGLIADDLPEAVPAVVAELSAVAP